MRAAIEIAALTRDTRAKGSKRGSSDVAWAKAKYDRQIVAMAKVNGATTIYSVDKDINALAKSAKINVVGLADLSLPPQKAQLDLQLTNPGPVLATDDSAKDETTPSEGN